MTSERTCHFTGDDAWKCGTHCTCQHFNWNNKGQTAMTSELRPAVGCGLCAKLTPDMEQTAARMAAQIGGVMQCRECGRAYETQAAELAKYKALAETLATDLRECARALQSLHQIPGTGADGRLWQRIKEITDAAHAAIAQYKEARDV